MRIFTDSEIAYWSENLGIKQFAEKTFDLPPLFDTNYKIVNNFVNNLNTVNYVFKFSISENNLERFDNLLNQFLSEGFELSDSTNKVHIERISKEDIDLLNTHLTKTKHSTRGVNFIRFSYNFVKVPTFLCVIYLQTIIDVIDIIGNYWEFNEHGEEICLVTYPTGTIVSLKTDKSDYFVESIQFLRKNTRDFNIIKKKYNVGEELILYTLLKINDSSSSQVIKFYENQIIKSSQDMIPNRGQRLDELLN